MTGRLLGTDPGCVVGRWASFDGLGKIGSPRFPVAPSGACRVLATLLLAAATEPFTPARHCIERVDPMLAQRISPTLIFGRGPGIIEEFIGAKLLPSALVWKRHFNLGDDKEQSRARATETWPDRAWLSSCKMDHGRVEAELIAMWGLRAAVAAGGEL